MKDINMSTQNGCMSLWSSIKGDIFHFDPCLLSKEHDDDVIRARSCRPCKLEFAWILFSIFDHILDCFKGALSPDVEHALILLDIAEGHKLLVILTAKDSIDELFWAEVIDGITIRRLRKNISRCLNACPSGQVRNIYRDL